MQGPGTCGPQCRAGPRFLVPSTDLQLIHYYSSFKDLIEAIVGLDRNVLHVHLGIALFIFLSWLFPGPTRYRKAFFWLLVVELLNEFFDIMMAVDARRTPNWPDSLADIINTLIWPAVYCLWRRHRKRRGKAVSPELDGSE